MLKLTFRYDYSTSKLKVEGLPDYSLSQEKDQIGILTNWELDLGNKSNLEGKFEHLLALINVVMPYTRNTLSGVKKKIGNTSDPVSISPINAGINHKLILNSSKANVQPLEIILNHSELADLVRCLDDFIHDPRIKLKINLPNDIPLPFNDVFNIKTRFKNLTIPILGFSLFVLITGIFISIPVPLPDKLETNSEDSAKTTILNFS